MIKIYVKVSCSIPGIWFGCLPRVQLTGGSCGQILEINIKAYNIDRPAKHSLLLTKLTKFL